MDFDSTSFDGGSYEKPKPGKYLGVLVGFAYCGLQSGGQYDDRKMVMLRWELHKRNGPSKDSQGFVHTITNTYGATFTDRSNLRKVIEAHGYEVPADGKAKSKDWLGLAAWLDIEYSDDGKWANVAAVSKLDPEDDEAPAPELGFEHWDNHDAEQGVKPPAWAGWKISRSLDPRLAAMAPDKGDKPPLSGGARRVSTPGPSAPWEAEDDSDNI